MAFWWHETGTYVFTWRETTPVCSGLTRLVRAGYFRHYSEASRERARITRRAQDGSVHMQRSLPSSSYPTRSTLTPPPTNKHTNTNTHTHTHTHTHTYTHTKWNACHYMMLVSLLRCKNEALTNVHFKSENRQVTGFILPISSHRLLW